MAAYNDLCSANKRGFNFGKTGGTGSRKGTRKGTPGTSKRQKSEANGRKGTRQETAETAANNGVATHFHGGKRQK